MDRKIWRAFTSVVSITGSWLALTLFCFSTNQLLCPLRVFSCHPVGLCGLFQRYWSGCLLQVWGFVVLLARTFEYSSSIFDYCSVLEGGMRRFWYRWVISFSIVLKTQKYLFFINIRVFMKNLFTLTQSSYSKSPYYHRSTFKRVLCFFTAVTTLGSFKLFGVDGSWAYHK